MKLGLCSIITCQWVRFGLISLSNNKDEAKWPNIFCQDKTLGTLQCVLSTYLGNWFAVSLFGVVF